MEHGTTRHPVSTSGVGSGIGGVSGTQGVSHTQGTHPAAGGVSTTSSTTHTGGARREGEHTAAQITEQVKKTGEQLYHQACDACHNWRHYPKLLTTLLLLSCFLGGALSMAGVSKAFSGRSTNYMASHWDRETADVHHALDVVLDHIHHPELYEHKQGAGVIHKARSSLSDILRGMWPGRKSRVSRDYDMGDQASGLYERSKDMLGVGRGGKMMGRDEGLMGGRSMYDKAGDLKDEAMYAVRGGMDKIRDVTGDLAHGVKKTFTSDDEYIPREMKPSSGGGLGSIFGFGGSKGVTDRVSEQMRRGVGGGRDQYMDYDDRDDFQAATQKLQRVAREAEREL